MTKIASFLQHLVLPVCLSASALIVAPVAAQASAAAQSRISAEISNAQMTAIPNSQQPLAKPEFETGRLAGNTKLEGITLHFSRSKSQQADLEKLIADQQNPSSPEYHQWLTPEQFGARFGMADSDLAKIQTWLEQQGFSVIDVARGKTYLRFTGTVAQVERAFATEMHTYNLTIYGKVEKHYAPSTAISVPSALAGVIESVGNLNDIRPRAHVLSSRAAAVNRPNFTSAQSQALFFAPGDIATQYDIQTVYQSGTFGTGQSIVVVGQSGIALSDIENFQNAAGLTVKDPEIILVPNTGTSTVYQGDESESDLDLEWSGAIAKGADIKFVYTGGDDSHNVFDSVAYAIDNKLAPIVSISYGACELEQATFGSFSLESSLQEASMQGQTVMAASGDDGSTDCFGFTNLNTAQQEGLAVDYPASSQYVTGVGGLMIDTSNSAYLTSGSAYWESASGTDAISSLLKYTPEVVWNEDTPGCGQTDCLGSGGGGVSSQWPKPSYQTALTPADSHRDVPDIALQASSGTPGFLFCTSDTSFWQSGQSSSCTSGFRDSSSGLLTYAGGTSFAAPIFSGMVALINQQQGYTQGQGQINPTLYTLAGKSATYNTAFHDIVSGNNDCLAGTGFCSGKIGSSAMPGYDTASGLGSVDVFNLINAWPANTGTVLIATTTNVSASTTAPAIGASVSFTVTVAATDGSIPTGTVSISVDGGTAISGNALSSNGTFVYTTTFTTAGSHSILASYSGDTTHATSAGTATVNVPGPTSGTGSFGLAATNITVSQGSTGTSTITVTPAGGYKGTVAFNLTTSSSALTNACYTVGNATVTGTAAATTTLSFDTNATDCLSAAVRKAKHLQRFTGTGVASNNNPPLSSGKTTSAAAIFAGLILAGFLGRYSKKLRVLAGLVLLVTFGMAFSGCGGSSSSTNNDPPKGNYTVTLTGQDTSVATIPQATTTFTVTIN